MHNIIIFVQQTNEYFMKVLKAADLFNNKESIDSIELENTSVINIDFSDVCSIDLKALNILLKMKKVAVLNNKNLSLTNVDSKVGQMLEITGLNKTFSRNATNPIKKA